MARQLTFLERGRISQLHNAGDSKAEITTELGRASSNHLSLPKIPSVNLGKCGLDRRESLPQRLEVRFAIEHG
jgi:hypothetical protein